MPPNGEARRRDDSLLDAERWRSLDRLRSSEGDKQDVIIVSLWQSSDLLVGAISRNDDYHKPRGPRGLIREHGPHWGIGAGVTGALVAGIEALGRLLG